MRVLNAVEHLEPIGGAERSMVEEAEVLSRAGYEFVVAYGRPGAFLARWEAMGAELVAVPLSVSARHPVDSLVGLVRSVRSLRRFEIDVVHCNFLYTLPLCLLVARRSGAAVVASVREPVTSGPRALAYRLLLRRVARIAFMSVQQRSAYEQRKVVQKGNPVIANGVDVSWFCPPSPLERAGARHELGIEEGELVVAYLGRIDPVKGIETLLQAMTPLPDPRIVVLIAGAAVPGHGREAYAARLASSAPPGVRFLGRHDDPRRLLWAADVVVVPSTWAEPLARSALEAMACGVPVVASRTGGLPEIMAGELDGLLFAPGNPDELRQALRRALIELGGERSWSQVVRERVVSRFSLDATARALDELLREASVTNKRRRDPVVSVDG